MSRIGKLPIQLPKGVEISVADNNNLSVKGPKGKLWTGLVRWNCFFGISHPHAAPESRPTTWSPFIHHHASRQKTTENSTQITV